MKDEKFTLAFPVALVALLLSALLFLTTGCGGNMAATIRPPAMIGQDSDESVRKHAALVLEEVQKRNLSVESDPAWIQESYKRFRIRNLAEIKEVEYADYRKYLDGGIVYVVVHPAYYAFFHNRAAGNWQEEAGLSRKNALDTFLDTSAFSSRTRLVKAQEKNLRDFLEYMSTEKKLVLLVLPRGYSTYPAYQYRTGNDEYMRYLNEVTNESESVVYLYSNKPNRGHLTERDRKRLIKFLYSIRANAIFIGGGYVGRCVEDFYKDMEQYYGEDKLYIVPELVTVSPSDISADLASDLLLYDGSVDISRLSETIETNALGNQDISPKLKHVFYSGPRQ